MKEILGKIFELESKFAEDAKLQAEKGNKAAGLRARKTSREIESAMKEFRKLSLTSK